MSSTQTTAPPASVPDNNKIIFLALGALFGLALFTFAAHMICVKCLLRTAGEDDMEEMGSQGENGHRRRRFRSRGNHFEDDELEEGFTSGRFLGLDKSVVELLPIFVFDPEAPFKDVMDCAVCLGEFAEGERGRYLPKCGHCFHVECIDMWFMSHSSCPLCRREVTLSPLMTLGSDVDDEQFPRSLSCPRFSAYRTQHQDVEDPLSDSIMARFRELIEESSVAGPSSPRTDTASGSGNVAITIPERASIDDTFEISIRESASEAGSSSSPSDAAAVKIDVSNENVEEEEKPPEEEAEPSKLTSSNSRHRYVDPPADESISALPIYCDR